MSALPCGCMQLEQHSFRDAVLHIILSNPKERDVYSIVLQAMKVEVYMPVPFVVFCK